MSGVDVVRALSGGARKVGAVTARAARHALWYVQYQAHGTPRKRKR
jgi:hypothetical protein